MQCKKCTSPGNIILRKKDVYCADCFTTNTNHKFRACIGKNKILSKNEKLLICLSGGLGSTVLLDLVHDGICMDSHKKLRITPVLLHIIGLESDSLTRAEKVKKQCNKYNYNVHFIHISQYMDTDLQLPEANIIPPVDSVTKSQYNSLLKNLSNTTSNDLKSKIKRNLFIKCALKLGCNFIFTAETTSTLAINLLSNLTLGRGSQVEHDVGFCDARNERIKIFKPMKEISQEELICYSNLKKLIPIEHDQIKPNSLQSVISAFVTDLQDSFPATISTVCKTADKIGNYGEKGRKTKCIICESDLGKEISKLTALDATKFSRTVSFGRPQSTTPPNLHDFNNIEDDVNKSFFPYINNKLCYGCSRKYSEMDKHNIPNHVQKL